MTLMFHKVVVGYFIIALPEIYCTAKSVGERILKIGKYLAKLKQKYRGTFFPGTV